MGETLKEAFNEDQSELAVLNRTPISFIIVGKPGSGKSTLAKKLAAVWKCQLIDGTSTIEELIKEETELAQSARKTLLDGGELSEDQVAKIIEDKLNSLEIQHYGYVLDCLPSYNESWKSVPEQLEFLKSLKQPPDVIINLKIPDKDLLKRRIGQKVDPINNEVFIKAVYDPDDDRKVMDKGEEEDEQDLENEEDGEDEDEIDGDDAKPLEDEFQDDLGEIDSLHLLAPDIADRLIKRSRDLTATVESEINHYKQNILRHIEDYIIQHNHQYVIELDANLSPKDLFRSLLVRITSLGLPRAIAPKRLINPDQTDEEEDDFEGIEMDQFLAQVKEMNILAPRFRWKRSRWSQYCPVELANGNLIKGKSAFSVGLMDKMYCLSSAEALEKFIRSPRTYLLPPHPLVPCKLCVVGPPTSGKSALAQGLANHYKATVINVQELLKPIMEKALESAINDAVQKAKDEAMARLAIEQQALKSQKKEEDATTYAITVSEDNPEVQAAMKSAADKVKETPIDPSPDMYFEAFSLGVKQAEEKRRQSDEDDREFGGWVVDGFPTHRDHWSVMTDANVLPDFVLNLETDEKEDLCLKRYCKLKGLPFPSSEEKQNNEEGSEDTETQQKVPLSPEIEQWRKKTAEFDNQWSVLNGVIRGSAIDPIRVELSLPVEEMIQAAIKEIESVFKYNVVDHSDLDEDAEADDDPVLEEGEDNEEDEEDERKEQDAARRRKPWGDTSYFCPVALKDQNVLWPGQQENAIRYREKLYYFSTEEAKEKFRANPLEYIAVDRPLEPPVPRIFLLGPRASGKTVVGRILAKKLNVFHISFRSYLQDQILPKLKRPPLEDPEDWEGETTEEEEEKENDDEQDIESDVLESLNEKEAEIRLYLLHGEPLSEETLEEYSQKFWNEEPYRSTGFIIEGLPHQVDELRYLCSKGLYPDAVAILEVEEDKVVERVLPGKMAIWRRKRDKRVAKKTAAREKVLKEWEDDKAKRKSEIEDDYNKKKGELEARKQEDDEGEEEDPFYDEYKEQLAEIEAEEPPEEEEEEEEGEEDVEEKMKSTLLEKYEEQNDNITSMQDVLNELQIPFTTVPANRKIPIVTYSLEKSLSRYFKDRPGLLTKCSPLEPSTAKKLLDHGYKQLSKFGYWCPVKLMEEPLSVLPPPSITSMFPVIYRQRVYFTSSSQARACFVSDPQLYLNQEVPRLPVPICLAVVGPPKSGKTTVAERFSKQYGCLRLSIGEALRKIIAQFPQSNLTEQILSHLRVGQTIPDELCVLALERALLDIQSSTRGYILDGWPLTKAQVDLLGLYRIVPIHIVELNVSNEVLLNRAELMRQSPNRLYPMHDSPSILLIRSGLYYKNIEAVKSWYTKTHDNWTIINGERNIWHVWCETQSIALLTAVQIQQYLIRVTEKKAASIYRLCVTSQEFTNRLGAFGEYCPVSFINKGELVDCSGQSSLQFAVEYDAKYYRTAGEKEMKEFLSDPEKFVGDSALSGLPPLDCLPCKRTELEVKGMFPRQYEIQGFCPVTYVDGKKRYEALVPGNSEWSVEYKGKLFCCSSKENLDKFMRYPERYNITKLPIKLPPLKQPLSILSLPMLGYMEQSVATPIINSLTAVGGCKPKFPFISATQSALLYIALHLKAYNPKSSVYVREKYRQKLKMFEDRCRLIGKLGEMMNKGYQEPSERPMEFERHMNSFLALVRTECK